MQLQGQFDTGVDVGRNDTALRRAEPGRSGVRSLAVRVLTVALLATLAALAALPAPPLQAQTVTTLVSNRHLTASIGSSSAFQAQSFETGANAGGYTVSAVGIKVATGSGRSTSVKIRENDANDKPGALVATLDNPTTLTNNIFNLFTASPAITLAASTTYWISVNEEISSNRASLARVSGDDETGETGWTIGNGRLYRSSEIANWSSENLSLFIEIKGTPITTLVSNTHLTSTNTSDVFQAQSFETGATGGYTVSAVDIYIATGSGKSTSVKIREDDSGDPATGDPVATLTNPGTLTDSSLNTFTASDVITLDASTTYWITVNEGISSSSDRAVLARVLEDDETGEPGWSIGNGRKLRSTETDPWATSSYSLVIEIKGTTGGTAGICDRTDEVQDGDPWQNLRRH